MRRSGPIRAIVFTNDWIGTNLSSWSVPKQDVVELEVEVPASRSVPHRSSRKVLIQTEAPVEKRDDSDVSQILADAIEAPLVHHLRQLGVTLRDKAALRSQTPTSTKAIEPNASELAALAPDVDLVIEARLLGGDDADGGPALVLRAIRTRNAELIAVASTRDTVTDDAGEVIPIGMRVRMALEGLLEDVAGRY
jgi:hypothetical protein